ncbi:hypothetical protein Q9R32_00320 [Actinotalea sp. AC32]|nr:hypothetical protein [Actinotalea sp. AC32]
MRFVVDTVASPAQARGALTDFTDRRLRTWSRSLDPRTYELRDQGPTWSVARESTAGSPFWVVVRYDWSDPDVVRWTTVDSSYGGGGTGTVRITPRDGGGSRLHVEYDHTGPQRQKVALFLITHLPMGRYIRRLWTQSLDRYARTSETDEGDPADGAHGVP